MKKFGYTCYIFLPVLREKDHREEVIEDKIRIIYCPATNVGVHGKYDWEILHQYHIDVVQVGADNQCYAPNLIRYCDEHHIPVYCYIGAIETHANHPLKRFVMKRLFRRNRRAYQSHKTFAKTESVKLQLIGCGIKDVGLAPVGVDLSAIPCIQVPKDVLREKHNLPVDKRIVLFVGRMEADKCPEGLLSVMERLPDYYYALIIGEGSLSEYIENQIRDRELRNRIRWIKRIRNEEIQECYALADFFLNFTKKEIFGMAILEAMYQGCTVIAVHAPGPDAILRNGETGYLVEDVDQMIRIILSDKRLNPEELRREIKNHFTWDRSSKVFDGWIRSELSVEVGNNR